MVKLQLYSKTTGYHKEALVIVIRGDCSSAESVAEALRRAATEFLLANQLTACTSLQTALDGGAGLCMLGNTP